MEEVFEVKSGLVTPHSLLGLFPREMGIWLLGR